MTPSERTAPRFLLGILWAATSPVQAHHSNVQFDLTETVSFDATVTSFEWKNPHVFIHVETTDETGTPRAWQVEGDGTPLLISLGWSSDSLRPGDRITVEASPPRDSDRRSLLGRSITTEDGTVLMPNPEFIRSRSTRSSNVATSIAGVWLPQREDFFAHMFAEITSLTDAGRRHRDTHDGIQVPAADCIAPPAPIIMLYPVHTQLEVLNDRVLVHSDWMGVERVIYTDGRGHPPAGEGTLQGHSIGRWQGETLVVDTALFAEHADGVGPGVPSGPQKRLEERLTLSQDGTALHYEFVLEDPEYLLEPRVGAGLWNYRPELEPAATECDLEVARRFQEAADRGR